MAISASDIETCYARVERGLFNVLYRMLWDAPACQDTMHDAFLRLWSQRERLHAASIDAPVYATALNLARNRLRWGRLWRWVALETQEEAAPSFLPDEARCAELRDLQDALQRLDAGDREILLLSEYAGLDTGELAQVLGVAAGTVGSRKHRALARLRALLKEDGDAG